MRSDEEWDSSWRRVSQVERSDLSCVSWEWRASRVSSGCGSGAGSGGVDVDSRVVSGVGEVASTSADGDGDALSSPSADPGALRSISPLSLAPPPFLATAAANLSCIDPLPPAASKLPLAGAGDALLDPADDRATTCVFAGVFESGGSSSRTLSSLDSRPARPFCRKFMARWWRCVGRGG